MRLAKHFALLELPDGSWRWTPCTENADGAVATEMSQLSDVFRPKVCYEDIYSVMTHEQSFKVSGQNPSPRDSLGLTIAEQKMLCGEEESEDYPEEKFTQFINHAK